MTFLFWCSLGLLLYTYAGYPVLVWALARLVGAETRDKRQETGDRGQGTGERDLPTVSLLLPAYNEEAYIEAKLRNSLALDYPSDRLEIVVASDGSTDRTNARAAAFAARGVKLLAFPHRGKSATINDAVPRLRSEILVFSDATIELEPDALRTLVRHFHDPSVGCVSASYRLRRSGDLRGEGEGLYWRYETFIKRQESRLHSVLGAHGPCYAIRAALFEPLGAQEINDDYLIPMRIVARGHRAVYEPEAVAWEPELVSVAGEFARRRRIAAGNCQQLVELRRLLNPLRGWTALCFFSHKALRTVAPVLLAILLVLSLWLPAPWSALALLPQGLLYGSALAGYWCQRRGRNVRWLAPPLYFCLGNLAMLAGCVRFCFARDRLVWERAR